MTVVKFLSIQPMYAWALAWARVLRWTLGILPWIFVEAALHWSLASVRRQHIFKSNSTCIAILNYTRHHMASRPFAVSSILVFIDLCLLYVYHPVWWLQSSLHYPPTPPPPSPPHTKKALNHLSPVWSIDRSPSGKDNNFHFKPCWIELYRLSFWPPPPLLQPLVHFPFFFFNSNSIWGLDEKEPVLWSQH